MSIEIKNFDEGEDAWQQWVAKQVSDYTNARTGETPQMLPVTEDEVTNKFAGFVALQGTEFAGYIGATQPVNANALHMSEVGTLWVPQPYRKHGIAKMLVAVISSALSNQGIVPYAFCNTLSLGVFTSVGFEVAGVEEIPVSAFEPCALCPCKPQSGGCCDTPVIYKGAL